MTTPTTEKKVRTKKAAAKEAVVWPEVGTFADKAAMKKHMKGLSDEQVAAWVAAKELSVKDYGSAPINRMRQIMAITELHFPSPPKAAKQESPYKKFTTEELIALAAEKEIPVEVTDDMRILRMRTIMSLRAHKVIE